MKHQSYKGECGWTVSIDLHYGLMGSVDFVLDYETEPYDSGGWSTPPSGGGVSDISWKCIGIDIFDNEGMSLTFSLNEKERTVITRLAERKLKKKAVEICETDLYCHQE